MLTQYIQAAMRHAAYKLLEGGTFFGEIPGLDLPNPHEGDITRPLPREILRKAGISRDERERL